MTLPARDPFADDPDLDVDLEEQLTSPAPGALEPTGHPAHHPTGPQALSGPPATRNPAPAPGPTAYRNPSAPAPSYQPQQLPTAAGPDLLEPPREAPPKARAPRRGGGGGRGPSGVAPRPGLIPGLDGLRALAVVSVLIFHYLPGTLPGGFLGVDVFFVVSGFLITTLLLREIDERGRVDLPAFWVRRARRLLPALLLVVLVSVTAARLVGEDLLVGIGRQVLGALTFTTNWLEIAAGASYAHSTSPILFVNFWSLAVEEQFYLLWPLTIVLLLAFTRTTRQRVAVVAGIGIASTIAMATQFDPGTDPTRVYYGTDTHLMGLMAGATFALLWADPALRAGLRSRVWRRFRGLATLGGLLVLVGLMRWMDHSAALTYRGGILLASLATVLLIAGSLEADGPWRRLMAAPPMTWLGQRSYGIYLWHWPVLVIAGALVPYALGTIRGVLVLLTALAVTLVAAELSLRLVERPVRRLGMRASLRALGDWLRTPWQHSRGPRLVAGGLVLVLLLTVIGLLTAPDKSATQRQLEATELRLQAQNVLELGVALGAVGTTEPAPAAGPAGDAGEDAQDVPAAQDETAPDVTDGGDEPGAEGQGDEPAEDELAAREVLVNGSPFAPDPDGLLVPDGSTITGFGDSLIVTSADGVSYRFPGTNYVAQSNRQWKDAEAVLASALEAGTVRANVIFHLGTNAGVDEDALRSALDALGPERNVVVMNLYLASSFTESSNTTIERVVADHPNAVVGDWQATITARPEVLQSDKVHPDIEGMHVYAEVVARAFDELARGQG